MQLRRIRSGVPEALENKEYNIGVGISLGNKWFTIENIIETVKWSLEHTKEYVLIYMADSIHAINLEVRKKVSSERAMEQALAMGQALMIEIKKAISEHFSPDEQERIHFAHWSDIADTAYLEKVSYLYKQYETDPAFRNAIESIVRNFLSREERRFNDEEVHKLGTYILEELPEQMLRVSAGKHPYDAFAYPSDSEIVQLGEKINKGEIFPEIKETIVDTEPKVFLVVS